MNQKTKNDLRVAERIYVDSEIAYNYALECGASKSASFRTFSPCLNLENVTRPISSDTIHALEVGAAELAEGLRRYFWEEDSDLATALGRQCYSALHELLYKAVCFDEQDFTQTITLVEPETAPDAIFNASFKSPLSKLLASNPSFSTIEIPLDRIPKPLDSRPQEPGLLARLLFANHGAKLYRLLIMLGSAFKKPTAKGSILVYRENELVKETALQFGFRGFLLWRLEIEDRAANSSSTSILTSEFQNFLSEQIQICFADVLIPHAITSVIRLFSKHLEEEARYYDVMRQCWKAQLKSLRNIRPRAILTNFAGGTLLAALHRELSDTKIPLCVFQHGVTMEYHATHYLYSAIHEASASDIAILFNDAGVETVQSSNFATANAVSVGLPFEYFATRRRFNLKRSPPIWYISTALYLGNRGALFEGVTDFQKSSFETAIVEDVLSKIPHQVLYKSYPGRRFLDPLPEEKAISLAENIDIFAHRYDLRYIVSHARILITSRSFSTPSWCLLSDKPVVHIDIPGQAGLTETAKKALSKAVFLFDASHPYFLNDLRDFLSQSMEEIENAYLEKKADRDEFIRQFVSSHNRGGAGKRAVNKILRLIDI
jgi:hypothetical protein